MIDPTGLGSALVQYFADKFGFYKAPLAAQAKRRPTGAALRNPADPVQAARIEAAATKRERKSLKLAATASGILNRAHRLSYNPNALNPFYVAK